MNVLTTVPCVTTISVPIKSRVIINGASQYFFLRRKKSHMSDNNSKKAFITKIFFQGQFYHHLLSLYKIQKCSFSFLMGHILLVS